LSIKRAASGYLGLIFTSHDNCRLNNTLSKLATETAGDTLRMDASPAVLVAFRCHPETDTGSFSVFAGHSVQPTHP